MLLKKLWKDYTRLGAILQQPEMHIATFVKGSSIPDCAILTFANEGL